MLLRSPEKVTYSQTHIMTEAEKQKEAELAAKRAAAIKAAQAKKAAAAAAAEKKES